MNEKSEDKSHISLGGNIELNGFQNVERSMLVVLKKIIGNYARQMKEKMSDCEKLIVALEGNNVKAELTAGGNSIVGEGNQSNMFMAIDLALKKVMEQI